MLFDDIEEDITNKLQFLNKQKDILKGITYSYGQIGTKINVLRAAQTILDQAYPPAPPESDQEELSSPLLSTSAAFDRFSIGYLGGTIHKKN